MATSIEAGMPLAIRIPMPTLHDAEHDASGMLSTLRDAFGTRVRADEPLARHGTFGVGGPADAWITVTGEADLLRLVRLAQEHAWPLLLIGNGTNALFSDAGARGIVARMDIAEWHIAAEDTDAALLVAGAGVSPPKLKIGRASCSESVDIHAVP